MGEICLAIGKTILWFLQEVETSGYRPGLVISPTMCESNALACR